MNMQKGADDLARMLSELLEIVSYCYMQNRHITIQIMNAYNIISFPDFF